MKTRLVIVTSLLTLLIANHAFGWGCRSYSCHRFDRIPISCPDNPCAPYETRCQCTDNGWRYNDCMSRCKYCVAFGNIGAR